MKFKSFRSNNDETRYVSLTSGHSYRIGVNWVDIPEFAWTECYANGCVSKDMFENTLKEIVDPEMLDKVKANAKRKDAIRQVMLKWYNENQADKFDSNGKPKLPALSTELGFRIFKPERDEIWFKVQETLK